MTLATFESHKDIDLAKDVATTRSLYYTAGVVRENTLIWITNGQPVGEFINISLNVGSENLMLHSHDGKIEWILEGFESLASRGKSWPVLCQEIEADTGADTVE